MEPTSSAAPTTNGAGTPKDPFEKKESQTHGQGLFVTKNLAAGEKILTLPRPCLAALDGPRLRDTCSNCYVWTGSTFREEDVEVKACNQCKTDRYCGKKCQVEAWKRIHKYECKALAKATNNGQRHLPSSCRLTMQLIIMMNTPTIPKETWEGFMSLHSHIEPLKASSEKVKQDIEILSSGALHYSEKADQCTPELAEAIFAMTYVNGHALVTPTLDPLGIIADPLLSIPNHSCAPNAFIVMDGAQLSLRSYRPLKKGEEIFLSYIDVTNPFLYRQNELQTRYQFTCACTKCALGDAGSESKFSNPPEKMSPAVSEKCKEYLQANPDALTDPSFAISTPKSDSKPNQNEALASLLFHSLDDARSRGPDDPDKQALLLSALKLANDSAVYPATRQPYPSLRQDYFVSCLSRPNEAFKHALKLYFLTPKLYLEPVHPIRVVYAWTYAKLAIYLSSPQSNGAAAGDPALKGVDWNVVVLGLLMEVNASVGKSHGVGSGFAKTVRRKLEEVRAEIGRGNAQAVKRAERKVEAQWKRLREIADAVEV